MHQEAILFLHIPKTGGTTLRGIIARQYPGTRLYNIGQDVIGSIREFRASPITERPADLILQGHMSYGLHRFVATPFSYVTMLRDPLTRALSDYHFVSTTPAHPLYPHVKDLSLGAYMASGMTGQLSNGQTRLVGGDCTAGDYGVPTNRALTEADLDAARAHIADHFTVVGLQERFDETLLLLRRRLGWKLPLYIRENITQRPYSVTSTDKTDLDLIRRQNDLDVALYTYATEHFEQAIARYGARFHTDLATFRILNAAFRHVARSTPATLRSGIGRLARRVIDF